MILDVFLHKKSPFDVMYKMKPLSESESGFVLGIGMT